MLELTVIEGKHRLLKLNCKTEKFSAFFFAPVFLYFSFFRVMGITHMVIIYYFTATLRQKRTKTYREDVDIDVDILPFQVENRG